MHVLRYDRPAREWTEALPIGNGFQGAMLFGGTAAERLQINDGTAWSGSPASEHLAPVVRAGDARAALAEARVALAAGRPAEAETQVRRLQHRYSQAFLPFADLELRITPAGASRWHRAAENYERCLDLDSALHRVRFTRDGITVRQDAFASSPDRVVVHRLRTDAPMDITVTLTSPLRTLSWFGPGGVDAASASPLELGLLLQLPSDVAPPHENTADPISWDPTPGASLRGAVTLGLRHDGAAPAPQQLSSATLILHAVTECDIVIGTATTFAGIGRAPEGDAHTASSHASAAVRGAFARGLDDVRRRQVADHQALYRRVRWQTTSEEADANAEVQPLDARLTAANGTGSHPLAHDHRLAPLLFHYGRYLLISCSRRGGTAANLQGIWNQELRPPWNSNYTTNINLQMNYWGADVANLPETLPPLVDLITALSRTGRETARRLYGARGWVAHHNTDIWAYSQPVGFGHADPRWAFWPLAGPWLVRHLQEHLSFGARSASSPEAFARDVIWPITRSAVEFSLDWLIELDDGTVGTAPSTSPENTYLAPGGAADGEAIAVSRSSALDVSLARELFGSLIQLADEHGYEDEVTARARKTIERIPGPSLGRDGTIREWLDDPVSEDPRHRHQSHLYPLYPGAGGLSPELLGGAARSLDLRGDESTGWSLVWRIALRARLGQQDAVERLLALLFRDMATVRGEWSGGLYPNLFAAHPPFQIDANLGYPAAIAECFVQSHDGRISLLPAVPEQFAAGTMKGLVARPGVQVDVRWGPAVPGERRELVSVRLSPLTSASRGTHRVVYGAATCVVDLTDGPVMLAAGPSDTLRRLRGAFPLDEEGA
ncbi:glycoside hydrolase family 95 protein [Streptacidiphilus carbonis]|uniref:glycoside hydrolase family 95 protein n=1 Tax=Streptacidiphilus carbonis TaxID=105422 RepID=UPI000693B796|nr:glycoside hydrolase family 95 protein [Streptacidiphilus carbonis]